MTEIVIDLETAGTRPGSAILSIGACAHVPGRPHDEMEEFYSTIDLHNSLAAGLQLDAETLGWWFVQDFIVRHEAFSGEQPLDQVLTNFAHWLKSVESGEESEIYGKGPSFDCAILAAAYTAIRQEIPWRYSRERCVRTVVAEAGRFLSNKELTDLYEPSLMPHHALCDARAEMRTLINVRARVARLISNPTECATL